MDLPGGATPGPTPSTRSVPASATTGPKPQQREDRFRRLINANLSLSSSKPNVALLIESSASIGGTSVVDSLDGFLTDATQARLVTNLADINALKVGGFFDELYNGNPQLLSQAAQLSRVDYILVGRATSSFRQANLDPDLLTCDLKVTCRLVDRSGTVVRSGSFVAAGAGFTQGNALNGAAENVARQLKEKILDFIR
jgi:hypothetical protein